MLKTWRDALRSAERSVLERTPDPELREWLDRNLRQPELTDDLATDEVIYLATLLDFLSLNDLGLRVLGDDTGVDSRNARARLMAAHGQYDEAFEEFEDALLDPRAEKIRPRILANLAATSLRAGNLEASERRLNLALSVRTAAGEDLALDLALASTRAGIAQARGDSASLRVAADTLAQTARRRVAQLDRGHPQGFLALADLAMVELELARIDHSVEKLGKVVTTLEAAMCGIAVTLGQNHPHTLTVLANLCAAELDFACMEGTAARISQAVEMSRQTYGRMREAMGDMHPQTLQMAANVAAAELEQARATDTESAARRALTALQTACERLAQILGANHPTTVAVLVNLASAQLDLARRGRRPEEIEQAISTLHMAADRVDRAFSSDHQISALIQRELDAGQVLMHGEGESADIGTGVTVAVRAPAIHDPSFNVRYLSFYDAASRAANAADTAAALPMPSPSARPLPQRGTAGTEFHGHSDIVGDGVLADEIVNLTTSERVAPAQLSHDIPNFIGRRSEMDRLDELAARVNETGRPETVVLYGMPGVGKSALAVHWACANADRFPGGQLFVDLRGYSEDKSMTDNDALGRLLHGLAVPDEEIPATPDAKAALYRTLLARRPMLVVLDNAADARQVEALRPGSSPTLVIVTSRSELRDLVAWGARAVRLDVFTPDEALDLVSAILGEQRVSAEASAAEELIVRCAYLPMALAMALADLAVREHTSIADVADRLVDGARLAQLTSEDGHSEVISAAFELSYRRLDAGQRRAFRYLGLLRGPDFTADAVAALWSVPPAAAAGLLEELERADLVLAAGPGRYRLHDLLWAYASQLVHTEDDAVARDVALHRYIVRQLTMAQDAGRYLDRHRRTIREEFTTPGERGDAGARALGLLWFETERASLIAIVEQAAEQEWRQIAWELADALYDYLDLRAYHGDNERVHRLGLVCARDSQDLRAQVFMGHHLATSLFKLGRYIEALSAAHTALEIAERIQDPYGESSLRSTICRIRYLTSDYPAALAEGERALELRRSLSDPHGEAESLVNIADIDIVLSRYHEALEYAAQALAIQQDLGDERGEATALDCMGRAEFLCSDYHQALDHHTRALKLYQRVGDQRGEAATRANMARSYRAISAYDQAIEAAGRALAVHRDVGDRQGEAEIRALISTIRWKTAHYPEAEREATAALHIQREIGDQRGQAESLRCLATVRQMTGKTQQAVYAALQALNICQEIGDASGEADTFDLLTRCYRALSLMPLAEADAGRALEIRRRIGDRRGEADTRNEAALNYMRLGDYAAALAESQRALAIRRDAGDRHGAAETLHGMAQIAGRQGHYDRALKHAERALRIRQNISDARGVGESLIELGDLSRLTADYEQARVLVERARLLCVELGDRYGEAECLTALGRIEHAVSAHEQALNWFIEALRIRRTIGDRDGEAELLSEISITCWRTTQYDRALANAHAALKIRRDTASRHGEAEALINIAQVLRRKGRYADALHHTEQALAIRREIGDRRGVAEALEIIALIERHQHRYGVSGERVAEALAICREIGDRQGEAEALDEQARVARDVGGEAAKAGDLDAGQEWLQQASGYARLSRAIRERIGDRRGLGDALHTLATTEHAVWSLNRLDGILDRATRHAELALKISRDVHDRYGESAVLDTLAKIHLDAGRLDDALYRARQALEIERSLADRFKSAKAYQLLGRVFAARGVFDEARVNLEAAREIWSETDNMPAMRETLNYLAEAYDALGRHDDAAAARADHPEAIPSSGSGSTRRTVTGTEQLGRFPLGGFWGALTEEEQRTLGEFATRRTYARGTVLCQEGDPSEFVIVILNGYAKVFTTSESGYEAMLGVRGPGDVVGEIGVVLRQPRTATVTALTRLTGLIMDGERFHKYVQSSPHANAVLNELVMNQQVESDRRLAMADAGGEQRLAALLRELSDRFGVPGPDGEILIDLPLSQTELGSWAGRSREMVARAYHRWREAGIIRNGRRAITIVDVAELQRIADGERRSGL